MGVVGETMNQPFRSRLSQHALPQGARVPKYSSSRNSAIAIAIMALSIDTFYSGTWTLRVQSSWRCYMEFHVLNVHIYLDGL